MSFASFSFKFAIFHFVLSIACASSAPRCCYSSRHLFLFHRFVLLFSMTSSPRWMRYAHFHIVLQLLKNLLVNCTTCVPLPVVFLQFFQLRNRITFLLFRHAWNGNMSSGTRGNKSRSGIRHSSYGFIKIVQPTTMLPFPSVFTANKPFPLHLQYSLSQVQHLTWPYSHT